MSCFAVRERLCRHFEKLPEFLFGGFSRDARRARKSFNERVRKLVSVIEPSQPPAQIPQTDAVAERATSCAADGRCGALVKTEKTDDAGDTDSLSVTLATTLYLKGKRDPVDSDPERVADVVWLGDLSAGKFGVLTDKERESNCRDVTLLGLGQYGSDIRQNDDGLSVPWNRFFIRVQSAADDSSFEYRDVKAVMRKNFATDRMVGRGVVDDKMCARVNEDAYSRMIRVADGPDGIGRAKRGRTDEGPTHADNVGKKANVSSGGQTVDLASGSE